MSKKGKGARTKGCELVGSTLVPACHRQCMRGVGIFIFSLASTLSLNTSSHMLHAYTSAAVFFTPRWATGMLPHVHQATLIFAGPAARLPDHELLLWMEGRRNHF